MTNGIIRQEIMRHQRAINKLRLKMNDVDREGQKTLDKRIKHHVKCLNDAKQLQGATI